MKIVIVIPTYNEKENIGLVIEALAEEFKLISNHDLHILVVEGNSPDGTAEVVKEKQQKYSFVHLLPEEKKAGLGAAYMYGFKHAVHELHADVVVEMDADFQHDPKDLKRLITEIDSGYDYVIGSRFSKGGRIPSNWSFYRKFLSIGGNIFSKLVLGIFEINDFTSGFKASRVKGFVDKIIDLPLLSGGFAYKLDLLYKMHQLGAKIKEVPIIFGLRDRGASKMENNNPLESLRVVITLRLGKNKNFIKFCIVGFIGLFTDTLLFNLLRAFFTTSNLSALISGLVAMIVTFTLNNYWSFKERKIPNISNKIIGFILYVISSFIPIVVRSKLVEYATLNFGDTFIVSNIAFLIGIIFGLIWNFTVYSKIIWRKK